MQRHIREPGARILRFLTATTKYVRFLVLGLAVTLRGPMNTNMHAGQDGGRKDE